MKMAAAMAMNATVDRLVCMVKAFWHSLARTLESRSLLILLVEMSFDQIAMRASHFKNFISL